MTSVKSLLLNLGKGKGVQMAMSHGGSGDAWKPTLERLLSPAVFPALYVGTRSIGGALSMPHVVTEPQIDHLAGRGSGLATNLRVQRHCKFVVEETDKARGETERLVLDRAKKWGLHNNGDEAYPERKSDSIKRVRDLFWQVGATDLLAFLERVHASRQKLDDLTDSFLLALETACELYEKTVKGLGLVTRPTRLGTPNPNLGTVRVLGIDPGTVNFSWCLLEVTGFEPGTTESYTLSDGVTVKEHFLSNPIFRVLRWEVINLEKDVVKGSYVLDETATPSPPYFSRKVVAKPEAAPKLPRRKPQAKRKRTAIEDDDDVVVVTPPNKRARVVDEGDDDVVVVSPKKRARLDE